MKRLDPASLAGAPGGYGPGAPTRLPTLEIAVKAALEAFDYIAPEGIDDGDVYAIMDVLEDRFSDSIVSCDFLSHESGRAGGLGRFRIEHRGDPDSLVRQFHGADGLPFTLDSRSSTRERLTVRINRKFAGAEH